MQKSRYTRRYEANSCGGVASKRKEDAAATSGAFPVGFKQEGFQSAAFENFVASIEVLDPAVKPVLKKALESITHFGATTSRKKFELTLQPLLQRLEKWFNDGV